MAEVLSNIHFKDYKEIINYDAVCKKRNHYVLKEKFIKSTSYFGIIHGDLNTKNIIVNNKDFRFIDRRLRQGDILFDFPFIMSLLCKYTKEKEFWYKRMVELFFETYSKRVPDIDNFFISLRNNFLNYGYFLYEDQSRRTPFFNEWSYSIKVSNQLSNFTSFIDYLQKL